MTFAIVRINNDGAQRSAPKNKPAKRKSRPKQTKTPYGRRQLLAETGTPKAPHVPACRHRAAVICVCGWRVLRGIWLSVVPSRCHERR